MTTAAEDFLADLVADVAAEVETIKADPLAAFDSARAEMIAAESAQRAWAHDHAQAGDIRKGEGWTYMKSSTGYTVQVSGGNDLLANALMALQAGMTTMPSGHSYRGEYTILADEEAIAGWLAESKRLLREVQETKQAFNDIEKAIDLRDLPEGCMVSFVTPYGEWQEDRQYGFITKVNPSTYTVTYDTSHPRFKGRYRLKGATARIDRTWKDGYGPSRKLTLVGGPNYASVRAEKIAEAEALEAEASALQAKGVQAKDEAYKVQNEVDEVLAGWSRKYSPEAMAVSARNAAIAEILLKHAEEFEAMQEENLAILRAEAGQKPVAIPDDKRIDYYRTPWTTFLSDEEREEHKRLEAEARVLRRALQS